MGSLKEVPNSFLKRLISFVFACENIRFSSLFAAWDVSRGGTSQATLVCIFFGMSPVRVQVSQAYKNVQKPRKRSGVIFELDEMFLLLHVVCNFDSVVVVCAGCLCNRPCHGFRRHVDESANP